MREKKISQDRLYEIIGNIICWAITCGNTTLHDMVYAADLTSEEIGELGLKNRTNEDDEENN